MLSESQMLTEDESINSPLRPKISPWAGALENPQKAQEQVLYDLLKKYGTTDYGSSHNALKVSGITDYRASFPIIDYKALLPYLAQAKEGNYKALLPEPPECWVMTRGSTGKSKVLPATPTHLKQIFTCGARALVHFALRKGRFDVGMADRLNFFLPTRGLPMTQEGKEVAY